MGPPWGCSACSGFARCPRAMLREKGELGSWPLSLAPREMTDVPSGCAGSRPCLSLAILVSLQGAELKTVLPVSRHDALWWDGCPSAEGPPES